MTSLYLAAIFAALLVWKKTRDFAIVFIPWVIYALVYDSMRYYPNYQVNPIDTGGVYDAEKGLFGINVSIDDVKLAASVCQGSAEAIWESGRLIPSEYFAIHHNDIADFMAGIFYLCWIPVPAFFALWLYFKKERALCIRFSWAFLLVNLIGFVGYYIHPASPPWYIMQKGFLALTGTPGNTAGLARWDALTGFNIFAGMYSKNSNVFAAIPSLHASYMVVATLYAIIGRRRWYTTLLFAFICVGIWCTAVYTGHHYVIDVILGILTAILGVILFEILWASCFKRFVKE